VELRRQFSNSSPAAKSLVKRLVQQIGKIGGVRTDPRFEDARGPNVRELRCIQRRLQRPEVEALLADYESGARVGELARAYGIHRTTVSAHVVRAGKTRGRLTEAQIDDELDQEQDGSVCLW
jgi:DNA invertase Pin-like site-specific DNA recombinase